MTRELLALTLGSTLHSFLDNKHKKSEQRKGHGRGRKEKRRPHVLG